MLFKVFSVACPANLLQACPMHFKPKAVLVVQVCGFRATGEVLVQSRRVFHPSNDRGRPKQAPGDRSIGDVGILSLWVAILFSGHLEVPLAAESALVQ